MQVRFLNMGDSALTMEIGDHINRNMASSVAAIDHRLGQELKSKRLVGVIEAVPTYRSLTVIFDPLILPRATLKRRLLALFNEDSDVADCATRCWRLPVCYDEQFGPDIAAVASAKVLTTAEVISLHADRTYMVYMIGFLPGFPYMGDLDHALYMPRRSAPRVRVPVGSVAITGQQTAIYPWESPGGWQLLGRCPLPLFDASRSEPALLAQGDQVKFEPISARSFQLLEVAAQDGSLDLSAFRLKETFA